MKKSLLIVFLASLFFSNVSLKAQNNLKYQGDIETGFAAGIGTFGFDRVNLHSSHGVRFNENFFLGAGTGLDLFTNYFDYPELALPVFLNAKGYLPISPKKSLFLSTKIGASFGLTEGVSGLSGFLFTPAIGISFNLKKDNAINLSLGYNLQKWGDSGITINNDAVSLNVGYQF